MVPQERDLITTLLTRLKSTTAQQKDPEADALIRQSMVEQPDALPVVTDPFGYILGEPRPLDRRRLESCRLLRRHPASETERVKDERTLVRLL